MHKMIELREMLVDELNNITAQNKMTQAILETVDKLTHSIKSIDTILAMEEGGSYGSYNRGSYRYDDDGSYARDRRGRNSDGSYRMRMDGGRDQRYSRGYSRDLRDGLEDLMADASMEEKKMLKHWIKQLED